MRLLMSYTVINEDQFVVDSGVFRGSIAYPKMSRNSKYIYY